MYERGERQAKQERLEQDDDYLEFQEEETSLLLGPEIKEPPPADIP